MPKRYSVLIMGGSYGSLLGVKLALAGHDVTLTCLPAEVEAFNSLGAIVRMPIRGRGAPIELDSRRAAGQLSATGPRGVDPRRFDLVCLAMQEPQYGSSGVRELLDVIARAGTPCMSIMNMPPLPYLRRIPKVDAEACRDCYTDPEVWDDFDPALITLCSPDPQAFRPAGEKPNILQVRLPTNFKAARFPSDSRTAILSTLAKDVEAVRVEVDGQPTELPVKLKVHDSVFVPLAKWPMLIAGNYRCVQDESARSIQEAVHGDLEASRSVYRWVSALCMELGAAEEDLVPFEKYAEAARSLGSPSSAARALFAGARNIERVDRLVREIAIQQGMRSDVVDCIVKRVDRRLAMNRAAA
ncbi:MAG: ketopantoate reductase family protein [Deltaproteobacteria bacterium]